MMKIFVLDDSLCYAFMPTAILAKAYCFCSVTENLVSFEICFLWFLCLIIRKTIVYSIYSFWKKCTLCTSEDFRYTLCTLFFSVFKINVSHFFLVCFINFCTYSIFVPFSSISLKMGFPWQAKALANAQYC